MSRDSRRLSLSPSGTSPLTMRWASPSTMAVLPTPGSPISTGLFLVRRCQDLDGAPDLVVAADDRVELALLRPLGEVDGVLLQGLALLLGVGIVHRLATAHLVDGLLQRALAGAGIAQQVAELAPVVHRREHEQLGGDVLIIALLGQLVRLVEQAPEVVGDVHVSGRTLDLRQALQGLAQTGAQPVDVDVRLGQQVACRAALLVQQGQHQVCRLDELVVATHRETLGIGQGHLELRRELVHPHGISPHFYKVIVKNWGIRPVIQANRRGRD